MKKLKSTEKKWKTQFLKSKLFLKKKITKNHKISLKKISLNVKIIKKKKILWKKKKIIFFNNKELILILLNQSFILFTLKHDKIKKKNKN
jgi:hypothetical protein